MPASPSPRSRSSSHSDNRDKSYTTYFPAAFRSLLTYLLKIPDHVADSVKFRGIPVRDPAAEFVLERHDQLFYVKRIEVPKKRRAVRDLILGDALVIRDDSPDPFGYGGLIRSHYCPVKT